MAQASEDTIEVRQFTFRDKMRAAQREANMRVNFYARRVAEGRMTQQEANEGIAIMRQIALDYGKLAKKEEASGRLL